MQNLNCQIYQIKFNTVINVHSIAYAYLPVQTVMFQNDLQSMQACRQLYTQYSMLLTLYENINTVHQKHKFWGQFYDIMLRSDNDSTLRSLSMTLTV